MALLRPLHPSVARQRLKSNLFFLFLAWTATTIFTPFTTLVRGSIWLIDEKLGSGSLMAWTWSLLEYALFSLFSWNIIEASYTIYSPPPISSIALEDAVKRSFAPVKPSSPLTRPYPTPERSTASPLSRSIVPRTLPTSTSNNQLSTPSRPSQQLSAPGSAHGASPLSSSTAKMLNLPRSSTSSSNGLFYDPNGNNSPSKAAGVTREQDQQQSSASGPGGDFVMVDREEREWVDNAWMGVRGRGGQLGM